MSAMRRIRVLIVAAVVGASGLLGAMPAHAMTCSTNLPDGGLVCKVVLTVVSPLCRKYPCG
jgi:hypothetical protein